MKRFYWIYLMLVAPCTFSQEVELKPDTGIPVTSQEKTLLNPWTGGVDAPQFSTIDLDQDGTDDLLVYDRISQSVSCYLKDSDGRYIFSPQYADSLPGDLHDWVLCRDYDQDGRADIFTSTSLGMKVYKNISTGKRLRFRLYHDRSPEPSPLLTVGFSGQLNIQMNASDIPSINDVDGDGDLDILVYRFSGSNTIEWHRNYSMENHQTLDSMEFIRATQAYNYLKECNCGIYTYDGSDCPPINGKTAHVAGKTLLSLDWEGDGDQDLFVSEETCTRLYLQNAEGDRFTGLIPQDFGNGLPFPAVFRLDVNGDDVPDLITAPNVISTRGSGVDFSSVVRVLVNTGSLSDPDYPSVYQPFLQDEMIDAGSFAAPVFEDVDHDGDLDLIVGFQGPHASLRYFENTGTLSSPSFTERNIDAGTILERGFDIVQPAFEDVDGDGLRDLVILAGNQFFGAALYYLDHTGSSLWDGELHMIFNELADGDSYSFFDVDGNSIPDLILGRSAGEVQLYAGERINGILDFTLAENNYLGIGDNALQRRPRLVFGDINGDGATDVIYSFGSGEIWWASDVFAQEAVFEELIPDKKPFGPSPQISLANLYHENQPMIFIGMSGGGIQSFRPANTIPKEEDVVSVYPNPVTHSHAPFVSIRSTRPVFLDLINSIGQTVFRGEPLEEDITRRFSTAGLSNGLYILIGRQGNRIIFSRRLIIDQ